MTQSATAGNSHSFSRNTTFRRREILIRLEPLRQYHTVSVTERRKTPDIFTCKKKKVNIGYNEEDFQVTHKISED